MTLGGGCSENCECDTKGPNPVPFLQSFMKYIFRLLRLFRIPLPQKDIISYQRVHKRKTTEPLIVSAGVTGKFAT